MSPRKKPEATPTEAAPKKPRRTKAEVAALYQQRATRALESALKDTPEYKSLSAAHKALTELVMGRFTAEEIGAINAATIAIGKAVGSLVVVKPTAPVEKQLTLTGDDAGEPPA